MVDINPWEDYEWDAAKGGQVSHLAASDISKRIYLCTEGNNADNDKAEFEPQVIGSQTIRYTLSWEDTLTPYPIADIIYAPAVQDANLVYPQKAPGSINVWFERTFTHDLQGVVLTGSDYEFKFLATSVTKYGIYDENISPVEYQGTQETWDLELDDFRPGTPFTIIGCDEAANDGFYRVKSVRTDGSNVFVIADNNNYEQQDLVVTAVIAGEASCDFGGDWYTLRSGNGNSSASGTGSKGKLNADFAEYTDTAYDATANDEWWTEKDMYHRYEETAGEVTYGPNDGRPPMGGQLSKDFNSDWVRTNNSSIYHTYDKNSHRFFIEAGATGSQPTTYTQYSTLLQTSKFMPFQADAKEIISPFKYQDTNRTAWKYRGKVKLKANQITDPANLGAIAAVIRTGYDSTGVSIARQYSSTHTWTTGSVTKTAEGYLPPNDSANDGALERWVNEKYNDALQNMVELACESKAWCKLANNTYATNWFDLHSTEYLNGAEEDYWYSTSTGTVAYSTLWGDEGVGGWKPSLNPDMTFYPELHDELWGENGSAFELILSGLGTDYYDWYYDDTFPYMSKRILDESWEYEDTASPTLPGTFNGVYCTTVAEVAEASWPMPDGVWRKTWKKSLGRVSATKMRSSLLSAPSVDVYESYALHPDGTTPVKAYGHFKMSAPSAGDFAGADLAANHDADYIVNSHDIYNNRVYAILNDCRDILKELKYNYVTATMSLADKKFPQTPGAAPGDTLQEYLNNLAAVSEVAYASTSFTTYTGSSEITVSTETAASYIALDDNWQDDVGDSGPTFGTLILTVPKDVGLFYATGEARKFNAILKGKTSDSNFYDGGGSLNDGKFNPSLRGLVQLSCLTNDDWYYGLVSIGADEAVEIVDAGSSYVLYFSLEPFFGHTCDLYEFFPLNFEGYSGVDVQVTSNNDILIEFDWDKFDDKIWDRTLERADYKLEDGIDDTKPPVQTNKFTTDVILSDINFHAWDSTIQANPLLYQSPYDIPDYEPSWKITAESILMEDLEGNGVYYIFDFEDTSQADKMDSEQLSRKYEEVLDMDTGAVAGDTDDAWEAMDGDIGEWDVTVNTRDNASAHPENPSDNTGTASTPAVAITLGDDVPIFPVVPRWKSVSGLGTSPTTVFEDGDYWQWVATDTPIVEPRNAVKEFRIEAYLIGVWTVVNDWSDAAPTPPAGVPAASIEEGCFWFQGLGYDEWRIRYRSSEHGKYSSEKTSVDYP